MDDLSSPRVTLAAAAPRIHRWGRMDKLAPMVFTDAKNVENNLIREDDFFQQVLHALGRTESEPCSRVRDDCSEAIYADLDCSVS
jgi:hypothetical protein